MIVCRPKSGAFFTLLIFLVIIITLLFGTLRLITYSPVWYWFILLVVVSLITLALFIKMMFSYKTINFTKQKVKAKYPLRFGMVDEYKLADEVIYWKEERKEVNRVTFLEIEILTKYGVNIKLNDREHTNVQKVLHFLRSNYNKLHWEKVQKGVKNRKNK